MAATARPNRIQRIALVAGAACLLAFGARAASEAPPTVDVQPDPRGASGIIHAQVDIDAPPEVVWKILVDCAEVPKLMVNVNYCRVAQRGPEGRWDLREQATKGSLLPSVHLLIHSDYDAPKTVRFHQVGGDFKVLEGEWRLEPLDGGARARVFYESRMSAPFAAPGPIVRAVLRSDMPKTLNNLRAASEAQAATTRVAQGGRP